MDSFITGKEKTTMGREESTINLRFLLPLIRSSPTKEYWQCHNLIIKKSCQTSEKFAIPLETLLVDASRLPNNIQSPHHLLLCSRRGTPPGVSGSIPVIRQLCRGGVQGAQVRERSLLALRVGRVFIVFFVIFAMKCLRWLECWSDLGVAEWVGESVDLDVMN